MAVKSIVTLLTAMSGLAVLKAAWPWKTIHQDERGVKLRFGRVVCNADGKPKEFVPGVRLVIPGVHILRKCRVQLRESSWDDQPVRLKDNLVYRVGMVLFFDVDDVYKAFYAIDNLEHAMEKTCNAELRGLLASRDHTQVSDPDEVACELRKRLHGRFDEWGVGQFEVRFHAFDPTGNTAELLLAEAMIAQVDRLCRENPGWSRTEVLAAGRGNVFLNAGAPVGAASNGHGNGHQETGGVLVEFAAG